MKHPSPCGHTSRSRGALSTAVVLSAIVAVVGAGGCSESSADGCPPGTLDCSCESNDTCLTGLVCQSGKCTQDGGPVGGTLGSGGASGGVSSGGGSGGASSGGASGGVRSGTSGGASSGGVSSGGA